MSVTVRFTPSLTGNLQIGPARIAVLNWLFARHSGGQFIVRIEDIDQVRSQDQEGEESNSTDAQNMLDQLAWLGLNWDQEPILSSQRLDIYQQAIQKLLDQGLAYRCYCTPAELTQIQEEQTNGKEVAHYDNRHRQLTQEQEATFRAEGRSAVIRFKIDQDRQISWNDLVHGQVTRKSSDLGGDIIIAGVAAPDQIGQPLQNLTVVVDDINLGITHVIQDEDLMITTPTQILLYEALAGKIPEFAHTPLILNESEQTRSKSASFISIFDFKKLGYTSEVITNYLTLLGWTPPDNKERFTLQQAAEKFSLERFNKTNSKFDWDKLNWLNSQYLHELPIAELTDLLISYWEEAGYKFDPISDRVWLEQLTTLISPSLVRLQDVVELSKVFFVEEIEFKQEAIIQLTKTESITILKGILEHLEQDYQLNKTNAHRLLKQITKEYKTKKEQPQRLLRAALMGELHGIDIIQSWLLLHQRGWDKMRLRLALNLPDSLTAIAEELSESVTEESENQNLELSPVKDQVTRNSLVEPMNNEPLNQEEDIAPITSNSESEQIINHSVALSQLESELAKIGNELQESETAQSQLNAQLHDTQIKLQQTDQDKSHLESALQEIQAQLNQSSQEKEQLQTVIQEHHQQQAQFQSQVEEIKRHLTKVEQQKSHFQLQVEEIKQQLIKANQQTVQFQAEIENSQKQKAQLQSQIATNETQLNQAHQQISQLQDELKKASQVKINLESELATRSQQILDKEKQLQQVEQERNLGQAQLAELDQNRSQLQAQIAQLESELNQSSQERSGLESQLTEIQTQLQQIKQERTEISTQLSSTQTELKQVEQELKLRQAQLGESDQTQSQLQAQIAQLESELKQSGQERSRLESQLAEMHIQLQQTEQERTQISSQLFLVQGHLHQSEQQRIQLQLQLEEAERKYSHFHYQFTITKSQLHQSEETRNQILLQLDEVERQRSQFEKQLEEVQAQSYQTQLEKTFVSSELLQSNQMRSQLSHQLSNLQEQLQKLQQEYSHTYNKLEQTDYDRSYFQFSLSQAYLKMNEVQKEKWDVTSQLLKSKEIQAQLKYQLADREIQLQQVQQEQSNTRSQLTEINQERSQLETKISQLQLRKALWIWGIVIALLVGSSLTLILVK